MIMAVVRCEHVVPKWKETLQDARGGEKKKSGSVERRRKRYVIEHPSRLSYCKKKIIKIKKFLTVPERVEIFLVHYTPTLSVTGAAERCSASTNE